MHGSKVGALVPCTIGHCAKRTEYVHQYATNIHDAADEEEGETDGELSEVEDFNSDGEDEPAGKLEDV